MNSDTDTPVSHRVIASGHYLCSCFSPLTLGQHLWHAQVKTLASSVVLFTLSLKIMGGKVWYPTAKYCSPLSSSTKKSFCPLGWILPANSWTGIKLFCSYWHLPFWDCFKSVIAVEYISQQGEGWRNYSLCSDSGNSVQHQIFALTNGKTEGWKWAKQEAEESPFRQKSGGVCVAESFPFVIKTQAG